MQVGGNVDHVLCGHIKNLIHTLGKNTVGRVGNCDDYRDDRRDKQDIFHRTLTVLFAHELVPGTPRNLNSNRN